MPRVIGFAVTIQAWKKSKRGRTNRADVAKKKIATRPSVPTGLLVAICAVLVVLVWLVFGQTLSHKFINYDDSAYVYENAAIKQGLSVAGIGWAFTHSHGGNWHPLTSISHELDHQLYGLAAGEHHFGNVVLHTIAVLALFFILHLVTGSICRSAFVAALFAIHPLRVESVAWIAERKDVLSGLFFMLSLGSYVWFVRRPSRGRYFLALVCFACGLLSKPMLVSLPVVFLLLDYWPLNRFKLSSPTAKSKQREARKSVWLIFKPLLIEKIPFFVLAAASCLITFWVQQQAVASIGQLPIGWRILNGFRSCLVYIGEMFWPLNLGLFYPFSEGNALLAQGFLALAALVVLTAVFFVARETHPYLITGWLWYLIMLLPVIGVIQVGMQAHADRYTYLPQIGLYLAITWGIADISAAWPYRRQLLASVAALIITALTFLSWKQTSYWRDSETIWRHTLAVADKSSIAEGGLADALLEQHRFTDSIPLYEEALRLKPDDEQSESNLGYAFRMIGKPDRAMACFEKAAQLASRESASRQATVHDNLGNFLLEQKQIDRAIEQFQEAVALDSNETEHVHLANALFRKGRVGEAISQYEYSLNLDPNSAEILVYLSWALATASDPSLRNGRRALELATHASHLAGNTVPAVGRSLAAAEAETGRFTEAIATAQSALQLAETQHDQHMAALLKRELFLYQSGQPYHGSYN
jgi:tetratricopeptide (TPR) repeat protein